MNNNLEKYKEDAHKKNLERKARIKELWNNLPPFNKPEDIPDIPVVDEKEYNEFYVPKLIAAGAIVKKDLIDGQVYIGQHRRCKIARWKKEDGEFEYWRNKFGHYYLDTCNHFEDDDGFALFVPIKLGKEEDFKPKI